MKIVIETSSLILIAKADIAENFIDSIDEVIISEEVYKEAVIVPLAEKKDALYLDSLVKKGKIKVVKVKNKELVEKTEKDFGMESGEAESMVLCKEAKADALMTDDYLAIKACSVQNIPVIQAIDVPVRLYETKKINKDEAIGTIEKLAKYGWYADWLTENAKRQIGE